jgi:hypothetical protein
MRLAFSISARGTMCGAGFIAAHQCEVGTLAEVEVSGLVNECGRQPARLRLWLLGVYPASCVDYVSPSVCHVPQAPGTSSAAGMIVSVEPWKHCAVRRRRCTNTRGLGRVSATVCCGVGRHHAFRLRVSRSVRQQVQGVSFHESVYRAASMPHHHLPHSRQTAALFARPKRQTSVAQQVNCPLYDNPAAYAQLVRQWFYALEQVTGTTN